MSPEDLGIEFAKLDSDAQVEFLQAAVDEGKTWGSGSVDSQWGFIGRELRKEEHSEVREMIDLIAHIASYRNPPEPEPTPEPPKPIDLMEPWND